MHRNAIACLLMGACLLRAEEKPIHLRVGNRLRIKMTSGKCIRTVVNPKEGVLSIRTIERDPTTILLHGAAPGISRIELEDVNGFRETKQVLVEADAERRVTGSRQVQLDVVVARVPSGKSKELCAPFSNEAETMEAAFVRTSTAKRVKEFREHLLAQEGKGKLKLIAQPRLVTRSGQPASFLDGGEQAVPVPAGLGQVGVQFEEFGTRINFLPIVLGNGRIHLEVEPEVSVLDANAGTAIAGAVVAGRATQRIHTTNEIASGESVLIGGLKQTRETEVPAKTPFARLLGRKAKKTEETDLLILVTPHLVEPEPAKEKRPSVEGLLRRLEKMQKEMDALKEELQKLDEGR